MSVTVGFYTATVSESVPSGPAWDGDLTVQDLLRNQSYLRVVLSEFDGTESSHGYWNLEHGLWKLQCQLL